MNWLPVCPLQWLPLSDHLIVTWPRYTPELLGSASKDMLQSQVHANIPPPPQGTSQVCDLQAAEVVALKSPRELVKNRMVDPIPEFLIQQVKGRGLRFCIFNRFPGDADAVGLGTTLWEALVLQADTQPPLQANTFPIGKKHPGRVKIEEKT